MAYDGSLKFDSGIDSSGFNKDLSGLFNAVKGVAMGYTGKKLMEYLIGSNADMEQYLTSFEVMLGSASKAKGLMDDLQSMANVTPFETSDLTAASQTLLSFGEDLKDLKGDLSMLGDISLGNAEKMKSLSLVFGQIQSAGKLMGQDLLQCINIGFNPLQIISQKTGESMADLKDKMSTGAISFEMVRDAMKSATSEGGLFYQSMEKQSKTMEGMLSTLKDYAAQAGRDIGDNAFEQLKTSLSDLMAKLEEAKANGTYDDVIEDIGNTANDLVSTLISAVKFVYEYKDAILAGAAAMVAFKAGMAVGNAINSAVAAYRALKTAIDTGTTSQLAFNVAMEANPIGIAIGAVGALVAVIGIAAASMDDMYEKAAKLREDAEKAGQKVADIKTEIEQLNQKIKELQDIGELSLAQEEDLNALKDQKELLEDCLLIEQERQKNADLEAEKAALDAVNKKDGGFAGLKRSIEAYKETSATLKQCQDNYNQAVIDGDAQMMDYWQHYIDGGKINLQVAEDDILLRQKNITETMQGVKGLTDEGVAANQEFLCLNSQLTELLNITNTGSTKQAVSEMAQYYEQQGKEKLEQAQKAAEQADKIFDDELKQLERNKSRGVISDNQYYSQKSALLKKYNKDTLEDYDSFYGSMKSYQASQAKESLSAQKQASEEAKRQQKETLNEMTETQEKAFDKWADGINSIAEEYSAAMDKIVSKREALQSKLESFGSLFKTETDEEGNSETTLNSLSDMSRALDKYENALKSIKMSGASEDFMNQFMSYDVEEALQFYEAMQSSSGGLSSYIESWQANHDKAAKIAEEFYADEVKTLKEDFVDKFNAALSEMPADMSLIGQDTVQGFIDGLNSKLKALEDVAAKIGQTVIDASRKSLDSHSPSRKMIALGHDTADGYTIGLQDKTEELQKAVEAMLKTPDGAELGRKLQAAVSLEMADTARNVAAKTTVINNNSSEEKGGDVYIDSRSTFTSPKALTPAESMRLKNQQDQRLVRQVANLRR